MQVPIRKSGKFSHQPIDYQMTNSKLDEYKKELSRLKFQHAPAASELRRLAAMGDLSENAAYTIAKGKLRYINERISQLESIIKKAIIIIEPSDKTKVSLGSTVVIESNGQIKTYKILGPSETNPSQGIISNQSPIGSALMGHKVGDLIKIAIANKVAEYKIIQIQ